MKISKIKWQVWEVITDDGEIFYGKTKKECLMALEGHTRQKSDHKSNSPLKKLPLKESFMLFLADFKAKQ
jgi:hypothetical protein